MTLAATGKLEMDANIQYLFTLVRGEVLRHFYLFFNDVENTETLNVDYYMKGLALYLPTVNFISKQKRAIPRGIKNAQSKVRHYAERLIDMNEHLASFPGETLDNKICVTELNKIILNSMPDSWPKKGYVQGFDCDK